MERRTPKRARTLFAACVALTCLMAPAAAVAEHQSGLDAAGGAQSRLDSGPQTALPFSPVTGGQHGPLFGHLPPAQQNLEVIGKLEPTRQFENIVEGQIADLAVHKGWAYLNSWNEPTCTRGGTYIADISNPASPQDVGFIPARRGYYHGEGAHVVSLDTPQFRGDLLAVNDEPCSDDTTRPADVPADAGGFDLYDVSDPERWQVLVRNAGDRSNDEGSLEQVEPYANSYHSVFVWQDGPRAYLVGVDNTELHDVDIFDITNPRQPEFIADIDLVELAAEQGVDIVSLSANNNNVFHHDVVVKRMGGQLRMLISYWDAGYVQVEVSDPANPVYLTDTSFDDPDPLTGFDPPEGNAHQAEYSHDNQYFLAADEDFAPDRVTSVEIEGVGSREGSSVPGGAPAAVLEDGVLNGPTVYGGYGCAASAPVPDRDTAGLPPLEPGEEAILVLQRGPTGDPSAPEAACFPGEKAQVAVDAGWDAVLLINRHLGAAADDSAFCGSGGFTSVTVAVCTTHTAGHEIFGDPPEYQLPVPTGEFPAIGTLGAKVEALAEFDGWGYAHLYDAETSQELDAFAIPEALDARFASGFGDLSIHEFATDPTENLGYISYYAGGIRVVRFSRAAGIEQVGAWIDQGGSNFWGVEQFTTPQGERLIAGSDRDFGLVILRYTGPGAPQPPSCQAAAAATGMGQAVRVPLSCSDANGNPLTLRIGSGPANGTLGPVENGAVVYTPDAGFKGSDAFTFRANDGAADSAPALATIDVAPAAAGRPSNRYTLRLGRWKNGRLVVVVNVPGPGRLNVGLQVNLPGASKLVRLARSTRRVTRAGNVRVTLKASKAERRRLNKALARSKRARLNGRVTIAYTPTGGTTRRSSRTIAIR